MIFKDAGLDDGIHGAGFLAESAKDTFGQVDIIAGGAAAAIGARLGFNRDRHRRAYGLAELAGDAALLAIRIAAQGVQAAKAMRLRGLLFGVLHGDLAPEHIAPGQAEALEQFPEQQAAEVIFNLYKHDQSNQGGVSSTTSAAITTSQTMVMGIKTFQPRRMIWS